MKEFAQIVHSLLGLRLTPVQIAAFVFYEQQLLDWNDRFNLTAITTVEQIRVKHFLDSLTCFLALRDSPMERVVDVGSGAGFPGLPLKIVSPSMHLTLIESVAKKAEFCRYLVEQLRLTDVEILSERVEVLGQSAAYRQQFDWALARAVAVMPVLTEYLLPLVRVGGAMLAMKGESAPAETQGAERAIHLLGGHIERLIPVNLPGVAEERFLVVIRKVAATPSGYPRRVGLPVKKPL